MRILSGIQPSGRLHLGNYFSMMKRMIHYQDTAQLFCFIVNFHAQTTVIDGDTLKNNTQEAILDFLSLGLDPEKAIFWVQSDVPEVLELAWYLGNFTPIGLLERSHSYKDKLAKGVAPNTGLFYYPVLMAADILLYQGEKIPVGKDQKQHIEISRDIAIKFNNTYGNIFILPEPEIDENLALIPGIDGQKMSKSYNNTIDIFSDHGTLKKRIMAIVTDAAPVEASKDPDKCNLYAIYKLFLDEAGKQSLRDRYLAGGLKYSVVKKEMVEVIYSHFEPYRKKREELAAHLDHVNAIMQNGADKARAIAVDTLDKVRQVTGICYR